MSLSAPFFRISLLEPPQLGGYGAYESPHETLDWQQPADRWQLLIVSHSGVCSCNGRVVPYGPRSAFVFPPKARCRLERSGRDGYEHIFAWFVPQESPDDNVAIPLVTDVTREFDAWEAQWSRAFDRIQFTRTGVQAWIWGVLWHLAKGPENVRMSVYVEAAGRIIQERISTKISVLEMAKELEISHSHLVRLFRAEHGMTIQEFIRMRRTVLACRLLSTSTRPIKTIATMVGVPDLQQFSHMIKDATGVSPRQFRQDRRSLEVHTLTTAREGVREDL